MLKFLSKEKEILSLSDHARGSFLRIARDFNNVFFPREEKRLVKNSVRHRVDNVFPKRGKRLVISGGSRSGSEVSRNRDDLRSYLKGRRPSPTGSFI